MTSENAAVEHMAAATEEATTPRQEEEEEDDNHHDPGAITAFWTAVEHKTSSSSHISNPSTDYLERLKSYQTALFCAKPACVSPIVCARFGWRCADKDLLACRTCGGVTALTTLPTTGLSVAAIHHVYQTYREQLATAHHIDCPFRFAAEQYLVPKPTTTCTTTNDNNDVIVLPTPFCSVLDPEIVALVEAPFPRRFLEQRLIQLQDRLPAGASLSRLVVPPALETYGGKDAQSSSEESSSSILQSLTRQNNILGTHDTSLLALAVLGWRPRSPPLAMDTTTTTTTTLSLTCPVCLAALDIDLTTTTTSTEVPPATKRIKRPNPLEAHRYYCPIVCGFPTTTPLTTTTGKTILPFWKVWLSRLDDETTNHHHQDTTPTDDTNEDKDDDTTTTRTTHRILQVLQMGLTPQKVTL